MRWYDREGKEISKVGQPEVYGDVVLSPDGKRASAQRTVDVSPGGGAQPRWRRDGKELYYIAPDRKLMAVSVKLGKTFENGAATPLFQTDVSSFTQSNRYDTTADGQRFLINSPIETTKEAPYNVILNWTSTLKK